MARYKMTELLTEILTAGLDKELPELLTLHGVSGHEHEVREYLDATFSESSLTRSTDRLGNFLVHRPGSQRRRILVAAHTDEIGLMVRHIDPHGFVHFETIGGVRPQNLFSRACEIKTGSGKIAGLLNSRTPGRPYQNDTVPGTHDFFIDVGASSDHEAADMGIAIGQPVKLDYQYRRLGNRIAGTALDDRVMVFILSAVVRALDSENAPAVDELAAVFTSQEEVGSRGAMTATRTVNPEYAIALDITLANDIPYQTPDEHITRIGSGPAVKAMDQIPSTMIGHIVPPDLIATLANTATAHNIPYQIEVQRAGSTDGATIQTVDTGVRTCGICLPSRYVHAHELVSVDDLFNTARLTYYAVKAFADRQPE